MFRTCDLVVCQIVAEKDAIAATEPAELVDKSRAAYAVGSSFASLPPYWLPTIDAGKLATHFALLPRFGILASGTLRGSVGHRHHTTSAGSLEVTREGCTPHPTTPEEIPTLALVPV